MLILDKKYGYLKPTIIQWMPFQKRLQFLFLFMVMSAFGQPKTDYEVLQSLINQELQKDESNLMLSCQRPNTVFDMETFRAESEEKIPQEVLYSLAIRALKSKTERWDSKNLKESVYRINGLKDIQCLSEKNIQKLFRKSGKRQNILLISTPVYDTSDQYCLVQVAHLKFTKSSYGQSCMLKRTNSGWVVIEEFDFWMS